MKFTIKDLVYDFQTSPVKSISPINLIIIETLLKVSHTAIP